MGSFRNSIFQRKIFSDTRLKKRSAFILCVGNRQHMTQQKKMVVGLLPQPFLFKDEDRQEKFEPTTEGVAWREQIAPPARSRPPRRSSKLPPTGSGAPERRMFEPIFIELRPGKVDRKAKLQQSAPPARSRSPRRSAGERNRTVDARIFSI